MPTCPSLSTCSWKMTTYVLSNRNKKVVFGWMRQHTKMNVFLRRKTSKRTHARTHARAHARTRARTHARTRTHTHRQFLLSQKRGLWQASFLLLVTVDTKNRCSKKASILSSCVRTPPSQWARDDPGVKMYLSWLHCYCMWAEKWRIVR